MKPAKEGGRFGAPLMRRELTAVMAFFVIVIAFRGAILLTGQRYLRSDEAAVGLMAKHIVTRGERPVFLYGQPYGGGHALAAYVAVPLFACFGRSAVLLTAISATFSTAGAALLWMMLRRYFGGKAALAGAALYAFSPPVVYQAFLVNGGAESFFLALAALYFFLRAYLDGRATKANGVLTGVLAGAAYWAMDYALLYVIVFVLLWVVSGGGRKWRWLACFVAGLIVGCMPLIVYNFGHDFAHLRHMFTQAPGPKVGFLAHFFGALWGLLSGDLAAFFGGEIDDFKPGGWGAWVHAAVALAAVGTLIYRYRAVISSALRGRPFAGDERRALPGALVPVVFILVYIGMYGAAKFSLPLMRTPRYFLPLCPFVSIAIALAALRAPGSSKASGRSGKTRWTEGWRPLGLAVVGFLVVRGAVASLSIGTRTWHEEHQVRTSGAEIAELAEFCRSKGIEFAFAPYEIQWRLMFEADESVIVSSERISPSPRYGWYQEEMIRAFESGETPIAAIFRRDFAFAEWAYGGRMGVMTRARWRRALATTGRPLEGTQVGEEFEVFYPVPRRMLAPLIRARPSP